MRKAFEEFTEPICWETSLVGDKASFQDETTDIDECYWISVKEVKQLLQLVREETLKEYSRSLDPYHFISNDMADYSKIELRDGFPKDSIEVINPEYGMT